LRKKIHSLCTAQERLSGNAKKKGGKTRVSDRINLLLFKMRSKLQRGMAKGTACGCGADHREGNRDKLAEKGSKVGDVKKEPN